MDRTRTTIVACALAASGAYARQDAEPEAAPPAEVEQSAGTQAAQPTGEAASLPPISEAARLTFEMEEVIVSATRTSVTGFDAPFTTHRVTDRQIFERSYRTTPEALRDIPGVLVQKTSHGQGSPFIRGFTGFRNLFLIDGVRLNNSVFRDGPNQYWNTVDPLSIERFEVVKGPSSVLYGSDAIGGTVSAFTESPNTYGEGVNAGGSVFYRYSSAENAHIGRGELGLSSGEAFGVRAGLSIKDFGDLKAGDPTGTQDETGYEEYNVDVKTEYWFDDQTRLVIAHQTVRQNNVPRTHRTVFAESFEGTTIGSDLRRDLDQERNLTYIQLRGDGIDGPVESFALNLSWQRQDEVRDRIRGSGARQLQGFEVNTIGLWGRFTSDTPIGRLTYGGEWYRDYVNSFSSTNDIQGPVADDATYDLVGVYIQNEMDITDTTTLTAGGRFNYARADANSVEDPVTGRRISIDDDFSSFVFSGRLTQELVPDHLNLFGGVSQGFRAPNLSDLTRLDTARTNEIETPSPGLDAEEFITYEVGLKTRGSWWAAQAAYFYTDIQDLIIRTPTGNMIAGDNEVTKRNSDGGFTQGVELSASVRPHPRWTVFGMFTWFDSEVETFPTSDADPVDEPLSRELPMNGQLGVRYDDPRERFFVEGTLTIFDEADDLSSRDAADTSRIPPGGTPGWEVFSLRGGWRINNQARLSVALENIFDEDYRVHGSGQNAPGRSLNVSVEITF